MRITRRLRCWAATLATPALAQDWPTRPVRCIVPYPPGGPTDLVGRVVAMRAQQELGQPLVIENRAGRVGHDRVGGGGARRAGWQRLPGECVGACDHPAHQPRHAL